MLKHEDDNNLRADRAVRDVETPPALDASQFCPNCSVKLVDRGCKLKCPQCGYFLSCSDFY